MKCAYLIIIRETYMLIGFTKHLTASINLTPMLFREKALRNFGYDISFIV